MIERLLAALDANATEPGGHVDALLAERLRNRALMWADFGQVTGPGRSPGLGRVPLAQEAELVGTARSAGTRLPQQ